MKHTFQLPQFPTSTFEIETSLWTGQPKLIMDNYPLERADEKGNPFLIPTSDQNYVKAFLKPTFPDPIPALEINGEKILLVKRLQWYQYVLGGLPILLLFLGGAIGGVIGAIATITNFNLFRQEGSEGLTYVKVIGVIVSSYLLYLLAATFFLQLIDRL